jgi:hypothetical protein
MHDPQISTHRHTSFTVEAQGCKAIEALEKADYVFLPQVIFADPVKWHHFLH